MKSSSFFQLSGISLAAVALVSCGSLQNLNQPLGETSFDPLDGPGSKRKSSGSSSVQATGSQYTPGQWVETAMANATFFREMPKGSASADKVLKAGLPMKVVKTQGSFVKVELDSGDIGFVPAIMVTERRAENQIYRAPKINRQQDVPIIPIEPGIPSQAPAGDLPPLPDVPPLPDSDLGIPASPSVTAPIPESIPVPVPVTKPQPLPDLPPPPEVPGLTAPKVAE